MDISKLNKYASEYQSMESQQDLKIDDDEQDTEIESEESELQNKKKLRKSKKRKPASTTATALLYKEKNPPDLFENTAKKTTKHKMDQMKQKIANTFQSQLKEHLKESFQDKAAAYIPDKIKLSKKVQEDNHLQRPITDSDPKPDQAQTLKHKKKMSQLKQTRQQTLVRTDLKQNVNNYITAYCQNLVEKNPRKQKELDKLKSELQQKGVNTRQLRHIEKGTYTVVYNDIKKMLKKQFLKTAFSFEKKATAEVLNNHSKYKSILEIAKANGFFNTDPDHLNRLKQETREDAKNFLIGELDRSLTETKLKTNSIPELMKTFDSFNNISDFARFNPSEYMKTFNQKLINEGLTRFVPPELKGPLDTDPQNKKDPNKQQQQDTQQDTEDNETDLLNLYIKSHLNHKLFNKLKLSWDIIKHERHCQSKSIAIHTIKEKAEKLANLRLRLELRQIFEERATLPELTGPEYKSIKSTLRKILKGLHRLKKPVSKAELTEIRDQSNRSLFTIIKEEYIKAKVYLESQPDSASLTRQKDQLAKTLVRLKNETPILEKMDPKLMQDLHFLSDVNIIEAA